MNYFKNGCILLLNDFADFYKQCNENFDAKHAKSLIESFLQSLETAQVADVSTLSNGIPATGAKILKPKTSNETGNKTDTILVNDFDKLTIDDIRSQKWNKAHQVNTLKNLCIALGLPTAKNRQTKSEIIDSLIKYKTNKTPDCKASSEAAENSDSETAETPEVSNKQIQKSKRKLVSSAIAPPPVLQIIKRHDLNLVFLEDDPVILVLSETKHLCGFIPKEAYNQKDLPSVCALTKDVRIIAKRMGIECEDLDQLDN